MPCDDCNVYIGNPESVDSPKINVGSCRATKKILTTTINGRSDKSLGVEVLDVGSVRNHHYGTVAMAPRPLHSTTTTTTTTTTTFSTSCSSSSSTSGSSRSSLDRSPRNESTNSSSSLILILERTSDIENNARIISGDNTLSNRQCESEDNFVDCQSVITTDSQQEESPSPSGLGSKGVTSSLETLAKKKSARCRRRRSTTSPRSVRQQREKSREEMLRTDENHLGETTTTKTETKTKTVPIDDDGFVATSTLMKNRESGVLSVLTNSSRSAGKVRLQSSASADPLARTLSSSQHLNHTADIGLAYTPTAIKPQQSTISVASIRATNIALDLSNNSNNNSNNLYSSMGGSPPSGSIRPANISQNFAVNVRCNVPSASAPALDRYHQQIPSLTRAFSSHSTNAHSSVPIGATLISSSAMSVHQQQQQRQKHQHQVAVKQNDKTTATPSTTSCTSTRASPVKASATSTVFPTGKSTPRGNDTTAPFPRVDSSTSLKSLSLNTGKMMKINRARTSLHASLGQLPTTTSPCVGGNAASLENVDTMATSTGLESNVDPSSMAITLYSSASPVDPTTLSPYATTRTSLERVCYSTGVSTMSSASSKTPFALPSVTSINVASAFKNALAPCNGNNNNNNNNNGRCNHLSGTCNGACNACITTTSQTSSTLTRTPNLVNGIASTSSWNNSAEQETDYVVDPVQGNAYHKGQFLGKGGFARVYLMTDVANGNQYACKIIPKNRMQKIHIQKIAREIMIHKELNHINVVQMHHYFEDNINVYMLLEPCPRKSLMHVLKYRGKVTEPEARYYMKQMVTGVAYIHSQKVVHRDLKPGNMFLSDGMIVKIGDFGLATRPDGQRRRVTICGTPNYIAPEVLYKQAYSYEADVWALGCILYALLAGQPPFDTATLKETYARICNNRYKKLDDTVVSRSGQDLIRWLLQPIPELRPSLERVKEHAYLTMEYVPTKLAHTCCYRMPPAHSLAQEQVQSVNPQQLGLSSTSVIPRALVSTENIDRNKRDLATGVIMQKSLHQMTSGTMSQAQVDALKIAGQKKPKVGNWLFRKLPKLPRFRQRLSRLLCPEQKKPDSVMMYRALEACLAEIRCTRAQENPMLVDRIAPLFVTKWIDYSNKYGLGFQLSDRSVGVLFNDSTKMSYTHDRRRVEYATTDDEVTRYRRELDVPSSMEEKLELLRHFTHYMDNFLTNGGEVKEQRPTKLSRTNSSSVPRMRRWLRTDKAIVMELTVPLLQVNFFVDHSKIVVSEGIRGRGYLVTYIDASRQASSYWLNDLRDIGCTAELYERLHYVCKVIAELENEAIFDPPSAVTHQQHRKAFRT